MNILNDTHIRSDIDVIPNYRRSSFVGTDRRELAEVAIVSNQRCFVENDGALMSDIQPVSDFGRLWNLKQSFASIYSPKYLTDESL